MALGSDDRIAALALKILSFMGCDLATDPRTVEAVDGLVLESAGLSLETWDAITSNWLASPKAAQFRTRAGRALEKGFGGSYLFAFGGRRTSRLLPFWQAVLSQEQIAPCYFLGVGDPLAATEGVAEGMFQFLWLRTMLDAERMTRGLPRVIASEELLRKDWTGLVEKIGASAGISWPRQPRQVERKVGSWLLQCESQLDDEGERSAVPLSSWARGVHLVLSRWASEGEDEGDFPVLDAIREAFDDAATAFVALAEQNGDPSGGQLVEALHTELEQAAGLVQAAREESRQAAAELLEQKHSQAALERELRGRIAHLESALRQRQTETDDYASQLSLVRRQLLDSQAEQFSAMRIKDEELATLAASLLSAERLAVDLRAEAGNYGEALRAKEQEFEIAAERLQQEIVSREEAEFKQRDVEGQLRERYSEVVTLTRLLAEAGEASRRATRNAEWAAAIAVLFQAKSGGTLSSGFLNFLPHAWHRARLLERLKREGLFDAEAYLRANPDVAQAGVDPLRHFLEHGIGEGRPSGLGWHAGAQTHLQGWS